MAQRSATRPASNGTLPSIVDDPRGWDAEWASVMDDIINDIERGRSTRTLIDATAHRAVGGTAGALDESSLWNQHTALSDLCRRANRLKDELLEQSFSLDFILAWKAEGNANAQQRDARACIPDYTMESFITGDALEALLDHFIESAIRHGETDFDEVVHPRVDTLLGISRTGLSQQSRAHNAALTTFIISRHVCLLTITRIIVAFYTFAGANNFASALEDARVWPISLTMTYALKEKPYCARAPSNPWTHTDELSHLRVPNAEENIDRPRDPHLRDGRTMKRGTAAPSRGRRRPPPKVKAAVPEKDVHCYCCMRERDQIEEFVKEGKDFLFCSKCLPLGRKMAYCSRDCQVTDYKARHRVICGKPLADVFTSRFFAPARPAPPPLGARWQYERMKRSSPSVYLLRLRPFKGPVVEFSIALGKDPRHAAARHARFVEKAGGLLYVTRTADDPEPEELGMGLLYLCHMMLRYIDPATLEAKHVDFARILDYIATDWRYSAGDLRAMCESRMDDLLAMMASEDEHEQREEQETKQEEEREKQRKEQREAGEKADVTDKAPSTGWSCIVA
ncbi:hypothetical protein JCM10213_000057 [Rhodosporidiobolus nylandii]